MAAIPEPQLLVEAGTDASVQRRIESLDHSIHEDPEQFKTTLSELGETALSGSVEYADRANRTPHAARGVAALIQEYLQNRYDLDHDYDDATNSSLQADTNYRQLLKTVQNARIEQVKTGIQRTESRSNLNAVPARDALRLYVFGHYIDRVVAYKKQEEVA